MFDIQVIGLRCFELDVTDSVSISNALSTHEPYVMVNTAAYTAVEKAESEMEQVCDVNRYGAEIIAKICAEHQIPLIHLSTDFISLMATIIIHIPRGTMKIPSIYTVRVNMKKNKLFALF